MSTMKKGKKAITDRSKGKYASIKDGESMKFTPMIGMEDMISVDLHSYWELNPAVHAVCIGEGCPSCHLENEPSFKAYLPIVTGEDSDTKIYSFGLMVARQLNDIDEDLGGIKGKQLKVTRRGSGFNTKYTVVGLGSSMDLAPYADRVPDIEAALGPLDKDGIVAVLQEAGLMDGGTAKTDW